MINKKLKEHCRHCDEFKDLRYNKPKGPNVRNYSVEERIILASSYAARRGWNFNTLKLSITKKTTLIENLGSHFTGIIVGPVCYIKII